MSCEIEHLDNYHQEENYIIVEGRNILLRLIPGKSLISKSPNLRKAISIPDMITSNRLAAFRSISKLSTQAKKELGDYINKPLSSTKELSDFKDKIEFITKSIGDEERKIGVSLASANFWSFCTDKKCNAFIGEFDGRINKCQKCNSSLGDDGKVRANYLDNIASGFLDGGIWFEDYMHMLLEKNGWKVWSHTEIMGNSGILHPIDLLAIKDGSILIAECKIGKVSPRDISHFMIQKLDIPSHFGFFFSLKECSSKNTAILFEKSTSLLLDNMEGKKDEEIIEKINKHIKKFTN